VVAAQDPLSTFIARWRAAGDAGPSPFRAWADACVPAVRALVHEFRPRVVLSELFTRELARLTKAAGGLPKCCLNPGCYFGPASPHPFGADFVGRTRYYIQHFRQGIGEADLVLHGTDPLFDSPPPALPRHHHYVGPLWWERPSHAMLQCLRSHRDLLPNDPYKGAQFPGDGYRHPLGVFAACDQLSIACAQPHLSHPTDSLHGLGQLFEPQSEMPADLGWLPVGPGPLDGGSASDPVAGCGDGPLATAYLSDVRHQGYDATSATSQ
jgi:hypothetical protein